MIIRQYGNSFWAVHPLQFTTCEFDVDQWNIIYHLIITVGLFHIKLCINITNNSGYHFDIEKSS